MENELNYTILNRDELPRDENTYEFVGAQYQDTEVSSILVDIHVNRQFVTHWLEY